MTATLNVNLAPCDCSHRRGLSDQCLSDCASAPVFIPCPIPRSVEFTVTLGECTCQDGRFRQGGRYRDGGVPHADGCFAHPIRVTCSIGGEAWAESEVNDIDLRRSEDYPQPPGWRVRLRTICRECWALVRALVLGASTMRGANGALLAQRSTVFSALCQMARMERAYYDAAQAIHKALPAVYVSSDMQVCDPGDAPSTRWLAAYMEHLIEQVGVRGVAKW